MLSAGIFFDPINSGDILSLDTNKDNARAAPRAGVSVASVVRELNSMKPRRAMFFGVLAIGLAIGSQAIAGSIPFPTGNFSLTVRGSEASSCAGGSCAVVLNIIEAGATVRDASGNGCGAHVAVVNTAPPGASAPIVATITHVFKVTHYDPGTGVGDQSLTEYFGGTCNGAIFNSAGATQVTDGTLHFVVSDGGNRIDNIVTALNVGGAPGSGYSIIFTERKQASSQNQQ